MERHKKLVAYQKQHYSKPWEPGKKDQKRVEKVLKMIGTGKLVLDVGCYDGYITQAIEKNNNVVYAMDLASEVLLLAKKKKLEVIVGNAEISFPFVNGFFDAIFAGEVIEHMFDLEQFFSEAKRVLKANGVIVLTTPNVASLGRRLLLLFGKNPYLEVSYAVGEAGHVKYFLKDTLLSTLEENGFDATVFCSDVVNFDSSGRYFSDLLARIRPTLGRSLMVKAQIKKSNNISQQSKS